MQSVWGGGGEGCDERCGTAATRGAMRGWIATFPVSGLWRTETRIYKTTFSRSWR